MRSTPRTALAFSPILAGVALAQNTEILGCADVDCPTYDNTAINECIVANSTFMNVGVAPVTTDDNDSALAGLSWVQGMDKPKPNSAFETSFLLGTPPSFYHNGNGTLRACAALFHDLDGIGAGMDSICLGIEGACLDALRERARNLRFEDGDNPCEKLEEDLRDNLDSECRGIVGDSNGGWPELSVRTIAGPGSAQPFSEQAKSSSNCWPVTSKDSNLAFIESRSKGSDSFGPEIILDWMQEVTPILTVVYEGSNRGNTSAQMTCIRAVDSSTASEENKDQGGGAMSVHLPSIGTSLGAVAVVGALVSLFANGGGRIVGHIGRHQNEQNEMQDTSLAE